MWWFLKDSLPADSTEWKTSSAVRCHGAPPRQRRGKTRLREFSYQTPPLVLP